MKRHIIRILFLLVAIPSIACSDPLTTLIVGGYENLLFANVLIGICEGLIVALLLRLRPWPSIGVMILANLASWHAGAFLVAPTRLQAIAESTTIYNVHQRMLILGLEGLLLAIAVEWPFCFGLALSIRRKFRGLLPATLGVTILAQVVSCSGLFAYLWHVNHWSMLMGIRPTTDLSFAAKTPATVYFFRNRDLYRIGIDGSHLRKVLAWDDLPSFQGRHRRFEPFLDPKRGYVSLRFVAPEIKDEAILCRHFADMPRSSQAPDWLGWHPLDLRMMGNRDSSLSLSGGEKQICLSVQVPIANLISKSEVMIPGEIVVYDMFSYHQHERSVHQIVALDLHARKIGVLIEGIKPIVTMRDPEEIDNDIRRNIERIHREAAVPKDP